MNFKYFIIGIYLTFVALIVMMVVKSCHQKVELESQNYYNEELAYQATIDAKQSGNPYQDSFKITEVNGYMTISSPVSVTADSLVLNFRKPDNAASDRKLVFVGNVIKPMPLKDFGRGMYKLSIRSYKKGNMMMIEKKIKL